MVPIFPDSFSILIFLPQASHPESHLHQMCHPKYSTPGVSPMIPREKIPYFLDYKTNFPSQIWEENGGASYSLNVAYLAHWQWGVIYVIKYFYHIFCFKIFSPIFLL